MAFWSGERLAEELPSLIAPYDPGQIDCAAYRLCLGEQVFITSDKILSGNPLEGLKTFLPKKPMQVAQGGDSDSIKIPPGQFAFLLTEEEVKVPLNALAWISIRTTYKFRGLINVSGFHVDPGWCGKLIFSVYNAGPASVHLRRGEDLFLILYSDLAHLPSQVPDSKAEYVYHGTRGRQDVIPSELISNMAGQVFSPMYLEREVRQIRSKLLRLDIIFSIILSLGAGAVIYYLRQPESQKQVQQQPTIINNYNIPPIQPSAKEIDKSKVADKKKK